MSRRDVQGKSHAERRHLLTPVADIAWAGDDRNHCNNDEEANEAQFSYAQVVSEQPVWTATMHVVALS